MFSASRCLAASRALHNATFLASANHLGDYPGATSGDPYGAHGPDGSRLSGSAATTSAGEIDLGFSERWRTSFECTLFKVQPGSEPPPLPKFVRL